MATDYEALGLDPDKLDFKGEVSNKFGHLGMGFDAFSPGEKWKIGNRVIRLSDYIDPKMVGTSGVPDKASIDNAWRKVFEDLDFETGLSASMAAQRGDRSKVDVPDPADETTGIAPPDTFQPFLREMQRRVSDRSLLSTSGRDRMMKGRQFSAPAPTPAPVMRAPTLPQRTQNSQSELYGQKNVAGAGQGLYGGSLKMPGAGIKFRRIRYGAIQQRFQVSHQRF